MLKSTLQACIQNIAIISFMSLKIV